ncbi:MAG TPA: hypothetical protein VFC19_14150 [Candidatus Limnocylindrales bacterium]|nr:hypothetical protein [Candidatus Limnocylindrales bacterium]
MGVVRDVGVLIHILLERSEIVVGRGCWVTPAGHGEYSGQIDGLGVGHDRLGVGHDRCDGVAGWTLSDDGRISEHGLDQRFAPVVVEAVPGPDFGDVGGFGEGVGGDASAVAAGQAVVAVLGREDLG